jgi:hypothetical protein
VSVSWFPEEAKGAALGELHIIVWRGTVARRGATRDKKGATIVAELTLHPLEPPEDDWLWKGSDDRRYDTASLAAKCMTLLEEQVKSAG